LIGLKTGKSYFSGDSMMKAHVFQHVPFEWLGSIEPWFKSEKFDVEATRFFRNEAPPKHTEFDWLIVLGGPMNIYQYDEYPWLRDEKDVIARALERGKTVLGICLGAQLIADVLGAETSRNHEREIGWFPVEFHDEIREHPAFKDLEKEQTVFHWHGDTFDIPDGAVEVAQSAGCKNQGFLYGDNVLGIQFHMETTESAARDLIEHSLHEITSGSYVQQPEYILTQSHLFKQINVQMDNLLNGLLQVSR
jgi:GMP synthase (glutamine-hydrolysing)